MCFISNFDYFASWSFHSENKQLLVFFSYYVFLYHFCLTVTTIPPSLCYTAIPNFRSVLLNRGLCSDKALLYSGFIFHVPGKTAANQVLEMSFLNELGKQKSRVTRLLSMVSDNKCKENPIKFHWVFSEVLSIKHFPH